MSESMKGKYFHNLDAKGRLIIPAKLRDSIGHKFVITQGFDNCLSAYSQEEWEKFAGKDDIVMTMGAGDVYKVGDMLLHKADQ